ncbi:MAG TPA: cytochrome c biogenesis heme-transporting ATPase CcmA [Nitrospiraceae bacterium]|nr:cytochrome c biogenesis heme-transporting ATPase CcmA [Nitrospiraceae bacterium]
MLEVVELSCNRGERRLFGGLSFMVPAGGLLSVMGENGCGKTTLLRLLSGLTSPEQGRIYWHGRDISQLKELYFAQLTYIGHRNALKDDLTPAENLQASTRIAGSGISFTAARSALDAVGLGRNLHLLATRLLSEGQKRRAALARLWFCERPLWLLDEPFTALDASASQILHERLQNHLKNGGLVVLATHQKVDVKAKSVGQLRLAG